jgi:hypothetical protein
MQWRGKRRDMSGFAWGKKRVLQHYSCENSCDLQVDL